MNYPNEINFLVDIGRSIDEPTLNHVQKKLAKYMATNFNEIKKEYQLLLLHPIVVGIDDKFINKRNSIRIYTINELEGISLFICNPMKLSDAKNNKDFDIDKFVESILPSNEVLIERLLKTKIIETLNGNKKQ